MLRPASVAWRRGTYVRGGERTRRNHCLRPSHVARRGRSCRRGDVRPWRTEAPRGADAYDDRREQHEEPPSPPGTTGHATHRHDATLLPRTNGRPALGAGGTRAQAGRAAPRTLAAAPCRATFGVHGTRANSWSRSSVPASRRRKAAQQSLPPSPTAGPPRAPPERRVARDRGLFKTRATRQTPLCSRRRLAGSGDLERVDRDLISHGHSQRLPANARLARDRS